jgi:hypothetical protein
MDISARAISLADGKATCLWAKLLETKKEPIKPMRKLEPGSERLVEDKRRAKFFGKVVRRIEVHAARRQYPGVESTERLGGL